MSSLVVAVRPFAAPVTLAPGTIVPSFEVKQQAPGRLEWGASGTIPAARPLVSLGGTSFKLETCSETYTEVSSERVTEDVDIKDPNNPDSTITVQRVKQASFTKKLQSDPQPKVEGFLDFGPDPVAVAFAEIADEFQPMAFQPRNEGLQNNCKNITIYNPPD